jgi:hypothetical protein
LAWKLTQTGGALFRRETLLAVGGWNEDQVRCQDNELYFRLLKHGARFDRCGYAGSVYRRFEGGSVSTEKVDLLRAEILRLLEEGEDFLKRNDALNSRRLQALNGMRFRLARGLWQTDRAVALNIDRLIHEQYPEFVPRSGEYVSTLYSFCFRFFGFKAAENIASYIRRLKAYKS